VSAGTKWLNTEKWTLCGAHPVDPEALKGRRCYAGLDLSNVSDITAFVLVFPMDDGTYQVLCWFWIPEGYAKERDRKAQTTTSYQHWVDRGLITLTDGEMIDYDAILDTILGRPEGDGKDAIVGLVDQYDIAEVNVDPYNSTQPVLRLLAEGVNAQLMQQGTKSMNDPTKFAEVLIGTERLHFGGHPILTWMAENCVSTRDGGDNIKLDKKKSMEKIDGMIAMIMGLAGAMSDAYRSTPSITVLSR
jgi:phage terminase large subunit-like protein